jgi:hypothetical protein
MGAAAAVDLVTPSLLNLSPVLAMASMGNEGYHVGSQRVTWAWPCHPSPPGAPATSRRVCHALLTASNSVPLLTPTSRL